MIDRAQPQLNWQRPSHGLLYAHLPVHTMVVRGTTGQYDSVRVRTQGDQLELKDKDASEPFKLV